MPSPFSEAIYPEWERLVRAQDRTLADGRTPHPDQMAGWHALDAKAKADGLWRVSAPDAFLIASLGVTVALQARRFEDAARLAQEYLDHPDARTDDPVYWEAMSVRAGIASILNGRIEEGVRRLDETLEDVARTTPTLRPTIRNDLIHAFADLGEGAAPDPILSAFVARLLEGWGAPTRAQPAKTHGELIEALKATLGNTREADCPPSTDI